MKRRNRLRITADDEGTTFNGSVECYTAIVSKLAPIRGPACEGYGFNRDPDGLWTEGTAQAAAVARLSGLGDKAQPLWRVLLAQQAGNGWLFATPQARISTGLAIGPDSVSNDFFYYHLPHLGATAWAAIAATGVNPFTGSQEAD